jgi:hypothetical protein
MSATFTLEQLLENFEKRIVEVSKQRDAAIESGMHYKKESEEWQRKFASRPYKELSQQHTSVLLQELKRRIEERDDE